jgi:hypothetical protein
MGICQSRKGPQLDLDGFNYLILMVHNF